MYPGLCQILKKKKKSAWECPAPTLLPRCSLLIMRSCIGAYCLLSSCFAVVLNILALKVFFIEVAGTGITKKLFIRKYGNVQQIYEFLLVN